MSLYTIHALSNDTPKEIVRELDEFFTFPIEKAWNVKSLLKAHENKKCSYLFSYISISGKPSIIVGLASDESLSDDPDCANGVELILLLSEEIRGRGLAAEINQVIARIVLAERVRFHLYIDVNNKTSLAAHYKIYPASLWTLWDDYDLRLSYFHFEVTASYLSSFASPFEKLFKDFYEEWLQSLVR